MASILDTCMVIIHEFMIFSQANVIINTLGHRMSTLDLQNMLVD